MRVATNRRVIPFSSFGGYRRWCWPWWKDIWRTLTVGWFYDLKTYWHRARYGWAPRDTWSLDAYLARVFGGALAHLAKSTHGTPGCYPYLDAHVLDADTGAPRPFVDGDSDDAVITDHERWEADLQRWADVFAAFARDDYYEIHGASNYDGWHADEKARSIALHAALKEMEPWFEALWD